MKYRLVWCCETRTYFRCLAVFLFVIVLIAYYTGSIFYKNCQHRSALQPTINLKIKLQSPKCENFLSNITSGRWFAAEPFDQKLAEEVNGYHEKYRKRVGISLTPWRPDGKCGYNNLARKVSRSWPRTGGFCNPESPSPCCTDIWNGKCVPITAENQCDCEHCVDTIRYNTDALVSEWKTTDKRCKWEKYSADGACSVLNKLSNENSTAHLYFVGDSLIRNMYMGLASILVGDLRRGIYRKIVADEIRDLCHGDNLFIQRECHLECVAFSLEELAIEPGKLCKGKRKFTVQYAGLGLPSDARDFLNFMKEINGKEDTYVIIGVGLHFQCKHEALIRNYLNPAFANKAPDWPRLIWVYPNTIGLLKEAIYLKTQSNEAVKKFTDSMDGYLKSIDIPIMDFRQITKAVASFDGTHYAAGVNMMKSQVLLNYLSLLREFDENEKRRRRNKK